MKENKGLGIAGFICSIASLLLVFMPYFGLPLAVLAMVFSKKSNTGLASAGNIISIIGIVINSLMLIFVVILLLVVSALQ